MMTSIFETLFFLLTFLSFSATTYSPPWTSSSMEFFALLAALSLFLSVPLKNQKILISENILFFLIFLLASYFFFFFQKINEKEKIWMVTLYGVFFIIYANSIKLKSEEFKEKTIITLLIAGLFNSFVILAQYFSLFQNEFGIWIADYSTTHGRPYGNFGQPNLAASLILTSLCCGIYLQKNGKISFKTLIIIAIFFGLALAFPSSKTSFLCLVVLASLALLLKDRASFFAFLITSATIAAVKLLTPATRDLSSGDISTGRFELWQTMLNALWQSPWFGYGALNTRVAHFESRELNITPKGQVIGSSHNLILDFFIWFGVIVGLILAIYYLQIIFNYLKHNQSNRKNIYLVFPIFIHSLLEYPLFYANFLLIFAFILNINSKNLFQIKSKIIPFIFAFIGIFLFSAIAMEYYKISMRFAELRFYNNNFARAEKPEPISLKLLDITGGQYNLFLIDKIENANDFRMIANLTKSTPSFKNFLLIIKYLKEHNKPQSEIDFWLMKARSSFSEAQVRILENESLKL